MIYLVSFIFFVVFVGCLALGFLVQRKKLLSEGEANAILEGLTCAYCTASCGFAGQKRKPSKKCKADLAIPSKTV